MMQYQCPVCGYGKMKEPPEGYYICPCCGTEFENDDRLKTHIELTRQWVANGVQWFSRATVQPEDWNPISQLVNAGLGEVLANNLQKSEPVQSISIGGPIHIFDKIKIEFSGSLLSHA